MYDYIKYDSPLGELTITAEGDSLTAVVISGQKYEDQHISGAGREMETPVLIKTRNWLDLYFAGECPDPAELALAPHGTEFQKRVWDELLTIPYGRTESYGTIASRLNSSARAVGSAVGRNPLSIIVPCHRVLGSDGNLCGYAGGLDNKIRLLRLEGIYESE